VSTGKDNEEGRRRNSEKRAGLQAGVLRLAVGFVWGNGGAAPAGLGRSGGRSGVRPGFGPGSRRILGADARKAVTECGRCLGSAGEKGTPQGGMASIGHWDGVSGYVMLLSLSKCRKASSEICSSPRQFGLLVVSFFIYGVYRLQQNLAMTARVALSFCLTEEEMLCLGCPWPDS